VTHLWVTTVAGNKAAFHYHQNTFSDNLMGGKASEAPIPFSIPEQFEIQGKPCLIIDKIYKIEDASYH
jgi:hypothetical protein